MNVIPPTISISIVSHLQAALVGDLLADIEQHSRFHSLQVILTLNVPESLAFDPGKFSFPVVVQANQQPQGFAANHNQAFRQATGLYFCVMNPDIRLNQDVFPALLECLDNTNIGVAAPLVVNAQGEREDSARHFPTPFKIMCKALGGCKGSDYAVQNEVIYPDWVGGMLMLFPHQYYAELGGFDERYFMYYEDVDLCARLRLHGHEVALCPAVSVVHLARRSSHRNPKYMRWHLASMLRFFCSVPFLKLCWRRMWWQ